MVFMIKGLSNSHDGIFGGGLCFLQKFIILQMYRHANVSLEMLLKLVAVFGPVIRSTISAPPAVGVNLQAEQRLECCNQCSVHLQKIQKILPVFVRLDPDTSDVIVDFYTNSSIQF
ncbi:putative katanin p80 subunit [Rosa chinensis]|uniref:Putative katanin p80 subunit n=1 Tax=Rosa chinensis TaxID=74649 RepID=A0A2P6Q3P3_ROSCH|nr:putative katanin p80 subunit [Rosa chinensis]